MCGIVGYIGKKERAFDFLIENLKKLEYRGYDSSGVGCAFFDEKNRKMSIAIKKSKGRVGVLEEKVMTKADEDSIRVLSASVGIGHTRWASHGQPNDTNSHPHQSQDKNFAVVHNGVIENYLPLKAMLEQKGFCFVSQTDTEVIAHLLENNFDTEIGKINACDGEKSVGSLNCVCTQTRQFDPIEGEIEPFDFEYTQLSGFLKHYTDLNNGYRMIQKDDKKDNEADLDFCDFSVKNSIKINDDFFKTNQSNAAKFKNCADCYTDAVLNSIIKTLDQIKGSFAVCILSCYCPDSIFCIRKDNPLAISIANTPINQANSNSPGDSNPPFAIICSDMSAVSKYSSSFVIPSQNQIAIVSQNKIKVVDLNKNEVVPQFFTADWDETASSKGEFAHFMLKEIYDQPKAVKTTALSTAEKLKKMPFLSKINKIVLLGCGSSFHAAMAAKYFIEKNAKIAVEVEIASEYQHKHLFGLNKKTLVVAISQSGETADTLAALKRVKGKAKTLAIVNVRLSAIARESDDVILTNAGPEIAVATTKGYLTQLVALFKLSKELKKRRFGQKKLKRNKTKGSLLIECKGRCGKRKRGAFSIRAKINVGDCGKVTEFKTSDEFLSDQIDQFLSNQPQLENIKSIAEKVFAADYAFYLGRGVDYPLAMEGALKLKEISYIHAQSYAAGELKHGTISLIEQGSPVVVICTDKTQSAKILSNIKEVQSRGAVVVAITPYKSILDECEYGIPLNGGGLAGNNLENSPFCTDQFLAAVACQLLAYFVALNRGCDIDKPKNLAKSVTVE
ncbi:MAG: glutamine--fructose-6-phosphate aminotransferase [Firmicutes bacterium]|nr:glutamine--fructose-6-phosphate aminotransferase [Bacillota bacterium]